MSYYVLYAERNISYDNEGYSQEITWVNGWEWFNNKEDAQARVDLLATGWYAQSYRGVEGPYIFCNEEPVEITTDEERKIQV